MTNEAATTTTTTTTAPSTDWLQWFEYAFYLALLAGVFFIAYQVKTGRWSLDRKPDLHVVAPAEAS